MFHPLRRNFTLRGIRICRWNSSQCNHLLDHVVRLGSEFLTSQLACTSVFILKIKLVASAQHVIMWCSGTELNCNLTQLMFLWFWISLAMMDAHERKDMNKSSLQPRRQASEVSLWYLGFFLGLDISGWNRFGISRYTCLHSGAVSALPSTLFLWPYIYLPPWKAPRLLAKVFCLLAFTCLVKAFRLLVQLPHLPARPPPLRRPYPSSWSMPGISPNQHLQTPAGPRQFRNPQTLLRLRARRRVIPPLPPRLSL